MHIACSVVAHAHAKKTPVGTGDRPLYFMGGSEAGVDLVLIQTFLLYNVNQVILMLTSIFRGQFS